MKLVACSSCHTQYDVSDVVVERFPCRCGESVENRPLEAVDAKVHRCGSCGAIAPADAEGCSYCGSAIVRDPGRLSLICPECYARCPDAARFCTACGVGFRPEEVRPEGYELPCPVCEVLMPPHAVGGLAVNECHRCRGLWVPGGGFEKLVARAIESRRNASAEARLEKSPRVSGSNPLSQRVRYRSCPECQRQMHRRNFRKSSGVIIDRCNEHGTWLDADELEQIAGFILSGETSAVFRTPEPVSRPAANRYTPLPVRGRLGSGTRSGESAVGSLLEILSGLLG